MHIGIWESAGIANFMILLYVIAFLKGIASSARNSLALGLIRLFYGQRVSLRRCPFSHMLTEFVNSLFLNMAWKSSLSLRQRRDNGYDGGGRDVPRVMSVTHQTKGSQKRGPCLAEGVPRYGGV